MTYMVEVASSERTFNALQNQRLKNAFKNVAPKVAPKNSWLGMDAYGRAQTTKKP